MRIIGLLLLIILISAAFWFLNQKDSEVSVIPDIEQPISSPDTVLNKDNIEPTIQLESDSPVQDTESNSSPFTGPSIEVDESLYGDGPSTGADTTLPLIAPEDSLPN